MKLNALHPGPGSKRVAKRVGRGIGSGLGKTGGRGHKGQKARAGAGKGAGFEGGQMPLQRRLPKYGFHSRTEASNGEVRIDVLARLEADEVSLETLQAARIVGRSVTRVKVIAGGVLERPITVRGLAVSRGAREAIEQAGGKVEV